MWAAQQRWLRAIAIQNGLDPDTTLPEDILLLTTDDKGRLDAATDYDAAAKRVEYEDRLRHAAIP